VIRKGSVIENYRLPHSVLGILFQLAGFIMMLIATRTFKSRNVGFTSDFSGVPKGGSCEDL
jgi:hypothetical protein